MKLFHISDLHLGKTIYGKNMLEDQKDWVEKFLQKCEEKKPQAVLIAGDVYDRQTPSGDATELLGEMLTRLSEMDISVFIVAGNHDSGQKLAFLSGPLAKQHIHIAGKVEKEIVHCTLSDEHGPVTFWLVPYIYPDLVASVLDNKDIQSYEGAMKALLEAQDIDFTQRNVIVAHQFVTVAGEKAKMGGSESAVAGIGAMDYTVFDGFEYVALGHIHSTYPVGRKSIRYAGTPLCYHLDEARKEKAGDPDAAKNAGEPKSKGIQEIIIHEKGTEIEHNNIPIRPLHRMRHITGTKEEVYAYLKDDPGRGEYVGIAITDEKRTPEVDSYLRQLIDKRGGILMETYFGGNPLKNSGETATTEAVEEKNIEDLFADFFKEQNGGKDPDESQYKLMQFIGEMVRHQDSHKSLEEEDKEKAVNAILNQIEKIKEEAE